MRRLPLHSLAALLAVGLATSAAPARAIHRGYDAPIGSYRFMSRSA